MSEIPQRRDEEEIVQNFDFIEAITQEYGGKAVAISGNEVVASADNLQDLFELMRSGELDRNATFWIVPRPNERFYGSSQAA